MRLERDPRVRSAALIAQTFGMDPLTVLGERSTYRYVLRLAAHNIVQHEASKS